MALDETVDAQAGRPPACVVRVARCDLRVVPADWPFAIENASAIEAHWLKKTAANPCLFNGTIHLASRIAIGDGTLIGTLVPTPFKDYLYWRDAGFPETGRRDCFGSALIRSAEGYVLLGRQRAGGVNAGLAYPPGGFIDARDVRADGAVDIDASVAREIAEETGLYPAELTCVPGYLVTFAGPLVSVGIEWRSHLNAHDLRDRVLFVLATDLDPELTGIVIVRSLADLERETPEYARTLLGEVLGGGFL